MCEFIDFSKYKNLIKNNEDDSNNNKKEDVQIFPIGFFYANKLMEQALLMVNAKNDFGAISLINDAIDLLLNNDNDDFEVDILGILQLNSKNFELANMYFYRIIADKKKRDRIPLMVFLTCLLDLKKSFKASNQIKNMIIENKDCVLAQVADVAINIKQELKSMGQCRLNIDAMKRAFIKDVKNRHLDVARGIINLLWAMDKTDPYINYWYFNLENCYSIYEIDHLPFIEIAKKCDEVLNAINDNNTLNELCTRRDCDCLIRFVMQFGGKELANIFLSYAVDVGGSRLKYHIYNYLFMSGNEDKKMILFLICLKKSLPFTEEFFVMRYRDCLVSVKYFSYEKLLKFDKLIASALLCAIENLIKAGFTDIDINETFLYFVNNYYNKMTDSDFRKIDIADYLVKIYCDRVGVVNINALKFK